MTEPPLAVDSALFESRAAFARRQNVSRQAVTQWAQAGRMVFASDGQVDVVASQARLAATLNSHGGKRQAGVLGGAQSGEGETGAFEFEGGVTLTQARTAQAKIKTRLDGLEYLERVGKLIERERFERAIADALAPIMSQLDTLSMRVAPKVSGEADVRRIQNIIDDEVDRLRTETAGMLRAMSVGAGITRN